MENFKSQFCVNFVIKFQKFTPNQESLKNMLKEKKRKRMCKFKVYLMRKYCFQEKTANFIFLPTC